MGELEHRWGRRLGVHLTVRFRCRPAAFGSGRLRNVSLSGAYIETCLALPVCSQVELSFDWTDSEGSVASEKLQGHVVRADANGIGIEWCELAPAGIRALLTDTACNIKRPALRTSDTNRAGG